MLAVQVPEQTSAFMPFSRLGEPPTESTPQKKYTHPHKHTYAIGAVRVPRTGVFLLVGRHPRLMPTTHKTHNTCAQARRYMQRRHHSHSGLLDGSLPQVLRGEAGASNLQVQRGSHLLKIHGRDLRQIRENIPPQCGKSVGKKRHRKQNWRERRKARIRQRMVAIIRPKVGSPISFETPRTGITGIECFLESEQGKRRGNSWDQHGRQRKAIMHRH